MNKNVKIYVDMDNTLVNYAKGASDLGVDGNDAKHIKGFFSNLEPMPNAIDAFNFLSENFDVYILTTSPWSNPQAAMEKIEWVQKHLPIAYKRVIISHHKNLNKGDYIIDDMPKNGVSEFDGIWIQIGSDKFPDWKTIIEYFRKKYEIN